MRKSFTLKRERVLMRYPPRKKPTRFRFSGNIRLGYRNNKVTEITKFRRVPLRKKKIYKR